MSKPVLVIGATGRYGEPAARQLRAKGFDVRVLSRDPERDRKRFGEGFEVVPGDASNAESLRAALAGCDGAHISVSGPAEAPAAQNVAGLAGELGLSRISYISGSATFEKNAKFPIIRTKLECEKAITESGVSYTILCPAFAMEVLPLHVQSGRASYFGTQPYPFHWLAAEDLGRIVAASYGTEAAANKKLFVWGPEALSIRETLERYCQALHPEIQTVSRLPFWAASLIAFAIRIPAMKTAIEVYTMYEGVCGDGGDPSEANRILGAPQTTLAQWLDGRKRQLS